MNYYEHHIGDYLKDTSRLSLAEHGAYLLLLSDYYANEAPLPANYTDLYRISRAFSSKEQSAVRHVADTYFTIEENGMRHNKRADKEIAKFSEKREKARSSANARWSNVDANAHANAHTNAHTNAYANAYANADADASLEHMPSQSPVTKREKQDQKPCPADAGRFDEFWSAFPRHENKKKAHDVWQRKRLDGRADSIIADVKARIADHRPWREGFVPHPTTYLTGERWDDAIDRASPTISHNRATGSPGDPAAYADGVVI